MIEDMEQAIAPLEKLAAEPRDKAAALDEEISRKDRERREAESLVQRELERRREELERQAAIAAAQAAHAAFSALSKPLRPPGGGCTLHFVKCPLAIAPTGRWLLLREWI